MSTQVNWERIAAAIYAEEQCPALTAGSAYAWRMLPAWARDRYVRMAQAAARALSEEPMKQTAGERFP